MGFKPPKPPKVPKPVTIDKSKLDNDADILARRLSVRKGYAANIKTSPQGVSDYGSSAQVPTLAPGGSPTLGSG